LVAWRFGPFSKQPWIKAADMQHEVLDAQAQAISLYYLHCRYELVLNVTLGDMTQIVLSTC
jgi:phosphoribosylformylglycinamidine (FGAM) synthase PurS component